MRRMQMTQRSWMTLVLAIITSWFLLESLGLSRVSSIVPRVILSLTLVLLIVQLLLDLKAPGRTTAVQAGVSIPADRRTPAWLVILWIASQTAAIWLFGVVGGGAVFCLAFLKWYAFDSWKISLAFAIALGVVLQLLFVVLFKITLYGGVIAQVLT